MRTGQPYTLEVAREHAAQLGEVGNGIVQGRALDGSGIMQIMWWCRHTLDQRSKRFVQGNDHFGHIIQTVIQEPDGSEQTIDSMVTRRIPGGDINGRMHVATTSDTTAQVARHLSAVPMDTRRSPARLKIHELGDAIEPEIRDGASLRRIVAVTRSTLNTRLQQSKHVGLFEFIAQPGGNEVDSSANRLAKQGFSGTAHDWVTNGVGLGVYGMADNDPAAFAEQPVALPLATDTGRGSLEAVVAYYLTLTGAMAVAGKHIIPTVTEPKLFYLNTPG